MNKDMLVVHTGGIGDFLLTCPALRCLSAQNVLHVLGRTERLQLAVMAGIAASANDMDSVGFDSVFSEPTPGFRAFLSRFGRAIVWMKHDDAIERAFRDAGVKEVSMFPGRPPEGWQRHASEYYLACLGLRCDHALRLDIVPSPSPFDVVIHPGSGGRRKNWPLERFVAVAEALDVHGRSVVWMLGPAEEGLRLPKGSQALSDISLADVAGILAGTRLYVGNDSGITHLAAAVGCPTVAIFGPTDPQVWAPRGDNVRVVVRTPWPETGEVLAVCRKTPAAAY